MNWFREIFTDPKSKQLSSSRVIMLLSFVLTLSMTALVSWIILDSYTRGVPIPELAWYLYGGAGTAAMGGSAYAFNTLSKNLPEPEEESFTPKTDEEDG